GLFTHVLPPPPDLVLASLTRCELAFSDFRDTAGQDMPALRAARFAYVERDHPFFVTLRKIWPLQLEEDRWFEANPMALRESSQSRDSSQPSASTSHTKVTNPATTVASPALANPATTVEAPALAKLSRKSKAAPKSDQLIMNEADDENGNESSEADSEGDANANGDLKGFVATQDDPPQVDSDEGTSDDEGHASRAKRAQTPAFSQKWDQEAPTEDAAETIRFLLAASFGADFAESIAAQVRAQGQRTPIDAIEFYESIKVAHHEAASHFPPNARRRLREQTMQPPSSSATAPGSKVLVPATSQLDVGSTPTQEGTLQEQFEASRAQNEEQETQDIESDEEGPAEVDELEESLDTAANAKTAVSKKPVRPKRGRVGPPSDSEADDDAAGASAASTSTKRPLHSDGFQPLPKRGRTKPAAPSDAAVGSAMFRQALEHAGNSFEAKRNQDLAAKDKGKGRSITSRR
ncbi:hypothetical protein JCM5296_001276, partial [Sporobolomyces johnsonii]